jgi:hypothetical protein
MPERVQQFAEQFRGLRQRQSIIHQFGDLVEMAVIDLGVLGRLDAQK